VVRRGSWRWSRIGRMFVGFHRVCSRMDLTALFSPPGLHLFHFPTQDARLMSVHGGTCIVCVPSLSKTQKCRQIWHRRSQTAKARKTYSKSTKISCAYVVLTESGGFALRHLPSMLRNNGSLWVHHASTLLIAHHLRPSRRGSTKANQAEIHGTGS